MRTTGKFTRRNHDYYSGRRRGYYHKSERIYIDKDLDGNLHLYADLSNTDRIKAVKLTVFDYSKNELGQMLETMCKKMNKWLFFDECPHCVIRMDKMRDMVSQNDAEADNG